MAIGRIFLFVCLIAVVSTTIACRGTYYSVMEKFGSEKRDILVSRVGSARDEQEKAKDQFVNALEQFKATVSFDGGNLEKQYNLLQREFDRAESRAGAVQSRIDAVETVAKDLFKEWQKELDQYTDPSLRRSSERQLRETQMRYEEMIAKMRTAEQKMGPVLDAFRDRVLFLKHNLNAAAIASLEGEAINLERDVEALIRDMEASINEANSFIGDMKGLN